MFILRYFRWNFCYNHWRSLATWQNDFLSFHYSAFFMLPVWCEKEFSKEVDAREKTQRHPTERRFLFDSPASWLRTLTQLINQFDITLLLVQIRKTSIQLLMRKLKLDILAFGLMSVIAKVKAPIAMTKKLCMKSSQRIFNHRRAQSDFKFRILANWLKKELT